MGPDGTPDRSGRRWQWSHQYVRHRRPNVAHYQDVLRDQYPRNVHIVNSRSGPTPYPRLGVVDWSHRSRTLVLRPRLPQSDCRKFRGPSGSSPERPSKEIDSTRCLNLRRREVVRSQREGRLTSALGTGSHFDPRPWVLRVTLTPPTRSTSGFLRESVFRGGCRGRGILHPSVRVSVPGVVGRRVSGVGYEVRRCSSSTCRVALR